MFSFFKSYEKLITNQLTDDQATPVVWAKETLYSPADQITQLKYSPSFNHYSNETPSYNTLGQMTQILTSIAGTDYLDI